MVEIQIKITDKVDRSNPMERKGFGAYKLDSFISRRLNIRDFMYFNGLLDINRLPQQFVNSYFNKEAGSETIIFLKIFRSLILFFILIFLKQRFCRGNKFKHSF